MKKAVLILAGGKGERLWPVSRRNVPKFFLKIGKKSLIQDAVLRGRRISGLKNVFVVCGENHRYLIKDHLAEAGINLSLENILPEPEGKNTACAIAFGIKFLLAKKENPVVFVLPADHLIKDEKKFLSVLKQAGKLAQEDIIVTVGIKPCFPHTGYGYIKINTKCKMKDVKFARVEKFIEKPDIAKAKKYFESNCYFWNAGIFIAKADVFWNELKTHRTDIEKGFEKWDGKNFRSLKDIYKNLPCISFDYAVMEKIKKAYLVEFKGEWNDLGNWNSIYNVLSKDRKGNVFRGRVFSLNSEKNLVFSTDKRIVALLGVKDLRIITTEDAILILSPEYSEYVKKIVKNLKNQDVLENHPTVIRPWGKYTVLEHRDNYKVKIIEVKPGGSLSLQKHLKRSEEWIVLKGKAEVQIGKRKHILSEDDRVKIPVNKLHRLKNKFKRSVKILEIARGTYIEEDDIIRVEDIYNRV
ncbi:MAG: mannose-1-phosphate guanylyltransferase/mannose-6-phosphate isomerase [Elusimicrobia bacterium]|nr:mannose-1-phosphate guanylyltransferase/mannose-6-phosphate isomerase [Elusimicrobiota bacterium]